MRHKVYNDSKMTESLILLSSKTNRTKNSSASKIDQAFGIKPVNDKEVFEYF
jgi:hypothetical protein